MGLYLTANKGKKMELLLIFMMIWCAVLLWCIIKETQREAQFLITVFFLSGGVLFFTWFLLPSDILFISRDQFIRVRSQHVYKWHMHFKTLFCLIIFLTILYIARVIGGRIDKGNRE